MTLQIEEEVKFPFDFDPSQVARDVITQALTEEGFPYEAEVELTLTDDETIRQLNQQFRQIDRSTDVLSFPMVEYPAGGDFSGLADMTDIVDPQTNEVLLGDIVISVDHVETQAKEYGHSIKREYAFLIAHSMLHLMGYDHMTPEEATVMEQKQELILQKLRITREDK
jgi:probable rRNA maturation factor